MSDLLIFHYHIRIYTCNVDDSFDTKCKFISKIATQSLWWSLMCKEYARIPPAPAQAIVVRRETWKFWENLNNFFQNMQIHMINSHVLSPEKVFFISEFAKNWQKEVMFALGGGDREYLVGIPRPHARSSSLLCPMHICTRQLCFHLYNESLTSAFNVSWQFRPSVVNHSALPSELWNSMYTPVLSCHYYHANHSITALEDMLKMWRHANVFRERRTKCWTAEHRSTESLSA